MPPGSEAPFPVDDCLVCRTPHILGTLTLVKSACGCDVLMCKACTRAPMTVEWLKYYASFCRACAVDLTMALGA